MSKLLKEQVLRNERLVGNITEGEFRKQLDVLEEQANIEQAAAKNIEKAIAAAVKDIPAIVTKFAQTQGDKDGELDPKGGQIKELTVNEGELNEVLGMLAGAALSGPAIAGLAGKLMKGAGNLGGKLTGLKKNWFTQAGEVVEKFGASWMAKYKAPIKAVLNKVMPNADEKTIDRAAHYIFFAIVAGVSLGVGTAVPPGSGEIAQAAGAGVGAAKTGVVANNAINIVKSIAQLNPADIESTAVKLMPTALGQVFG